MPTKNHNYVLFLKREEEGDFTILTGYELANNLVTPLDGDETGLAFSYYKNVDQAQFLKDLQAAIVKGGGVK